MILKHQTVVSFSFASNFGVEFALIGQLPQNEFKDEGVPIGFGIEISGLWYPTNTLGFGLNLGGTQYGSSERQIPFNYFTDLITIREKTTNNIGYGHLLIRFSPIQGKINPYFEGLIGFKNLNSLNLPQMSSGKSLQSFKPGFVSGSVYIGQQFRNHPARA